MFRIVISVLLFAALAGCAPVSSSTAPAVTTLSAGAATVIATSAPPVKTQLATAVAPMETLVATSAPAVAILVTTAIAPEPTSVATPAVQATPLAPSAPVTTTAATPASTGAAAQPVIVLKRSGGIAGKTAMLTVYSDGRITTDQGAERRIAPDQVAQLVTAIEDLGFFNLQSSYGQNTQCRDCFNYELTVSSGGKTHTVTFVQNPPDMPPELAQIMALITGVIGSAP